jgi:hypothetical protein
MKEIEGNRLWKTKLILERSKKGLGFQSIFLSGVTVLPVVQQSTASRYDIH